MTETSIDWFSHDDHDCDPLLSQLALLGPAGWRVSLLVGGLQVSGTLISAHDYLAEFDKQLAPYDTDMGSYAGFLRHEVREGPTRGANPIPDAVNRDPEASRARWIHLARAKVSRPGDSGQRVSLWRGRTSSVDGWSLLPPRAQSQQ